MRPEGSARPAGLGRSIPRVVGYPGGHVQLAQTQHSTYTAAAQHSARVRALCSAIPARPPPPAWDDAPAGSPGTRWLRQPA